MLLKAAGNSFLIRYHMPFTMASATQARLDPPQRRKFLLLGLSIWHELCLQNFCLG